MSKKTLTYQEVYDQLKKAGKPIKFGVDNNAKNKGGYHEIYFTIDDVDNSISSFNSNTGRDPDTEAVDYEWNKSWEYLYKGKFYELDQSDKAKKQQYSITYTIAPNTRVSLYHEDNDRLRLRGAKEVIFSQPNKLLILFEKKENYVQIGCKDFSVTLDKGRILTGLEIYI